MQAKVLSAPPLQPLNHLSLGQCRPLLCNTPVMVCNTCTTHIRHCAIHPRHYITHLGHCIIHLSYCATLVGHCATHLGHCAIHLRHFQSSLHMPRGFIYLVVLSSLYSYWFLKVFPQIVQMSAQQEQDHQTCTNLKKAPLTGGA